MFIDQVEQEKKEASNSKDLVKLMRLIDGIYIRNGKVCCEKYFMKMFAACTTTEHFKVPENQKHDNRIYLLFPQEMLENIMLRKMNNYSVCTKLIHRSLCEGHRFCKGKTYEDVRYIPGLLLQVERIVLIDRPMYHYWHRLGSVCSSPFSVNSGCLSEPVHHIAARWNQWSHHLSAVFQYHGRSVMLRNPHIGAERLQHCKPG